MSLNVFRTCKECGKDSNVKFTPTITCPHCATKNDCIIQGQETPEWMEKHGERNSGRTTRLADHYIQELFINNEVEIKDHYPQESAHYYLLRVIANRLDFEHLNVKYKIKNLKIILL